MTRPIALMLLGLLVMTSPVARGADAPLPKAKEPVEAVRGYWEGVRAKRALDAVAAYMDLEGMIDVIDKDSGAPEPTAAQRKSAVQSMTDVITAAWKNPKVAAALDQSTFEIGQTTKVDENTTTIDYSVSLTVDGKPTTLPNQATVHKTASGWKILEMRQGANAPTLTDAIHTGFVAYRKQKPGATIDTFLNEVASSVRAKMGGGQGTK